jgi:prepilin-type N-terminal cleavage/methylation domain-containing protein
VSAVQKAFTLVELLVTIAIVAVLAAILFPVLSGARESANRSVCLSNQKQISAATHLYLSDYDERFMPTSYIVENQANSRNDRTWVQLVLPYIRSFASFRCPSDHTERPKAESTFDSDLVPGDTDSQYYSASMRSNYGFNYQYLSPTVLMGGHWVSRPRSMSDVGRPSDTLMFIDSVWSRSDDGHPEGGGNWLVTPPCRFYAMANGRPQDSFTGSNFEQMVFTISRGWSSSQAAPHVYGNAWPWHRNSMNVSRVDGSATTVTPDRLRAGCDAQPDWRGSVLDSGAYMWDLR